MIPLCNRCYGPLDWGNHGLYQCPLQPRRANAVWPDAIPGGLVIEHGLCDDDGNPVTYYSRTEMRAACDAKGMRPWSDVHAEDLPRLKEARQLAEWSARAGDAITQRRLNDERERDAGRDREAGRDCETGGRRRR